MGRIVGIVVDDQVIELGVLDFSGIGDHPLGFGAPFRTVLPVFLLLFRRFLRDHGLYDRIRRGTGGRRWLHVPDRRRDTDRATGIREISGRRGIGHQPAIRGLGGVADDGNAEVLAAAGMVDSGLVHALVAVGLHGGIRGVYRFQNERPGIRIIGALVAYLHHRNRSAGVAGIGDRGIDFSGGAVGFVTEGVGNIRALHPFQLDFETVGIAAGVVDDIEVRKRAERGAGVGWQCRQTSQGKGALDDAADSDRRGLLSFFVHGNFLAVMGCRMDLAERAAQMVRCRFAKAGRPINTNQAVPGRGTPPGGGGAASMTTALPV